MDILKTLYPDAEYKGYTIKFVECGLVGEYHLYKGEERIKPYYFDSIKQGKEAIDKIILI